VDSNVRGTSILLDILANETQHVRKLVIPSSNTIYGEGTYHCKEHGAVYPQARAKDHIEARDWELHCTICGQPVSPLPTPEPKPLNPTSIYAITKQTQEQMCLTVGRAYNIPTVALRYFNVYGPRQALSNPYTGLISTFLCRLLNDHPPLIYEDGYQTRDLVHIRDIVQANLMAMLQEEMDYCIFNVGTGRALSVIEIANALIRNFPGEGKEAEITNRYRTGDIRHCFANISRIQERGYRPQVQFEQGVLDVIDWVKGQQADDRTDQAQKELTSRRLTL
jgi:dTDP-L-rhamnose 4-epimerase